jgi:carbon monoxide dehydrogenase subunit G
MARSTRTFTVAAPPAQVEAFLAEPTNAAAWDVTVASIDPVPTIPGAWDLVVAFYGKRIPFRLVRHTTEPGRLVEHRGEHAHARMTERFELAPCPDGGTSVTYLAEVRLTGALRLLNKGLDSAFAAVKAKSAARLAAALEELATTGGR